jgi:hypothetical protein
MATRIIFRIVELAKEKEAAGDSSAERSALTQKIRALLCRNILASRSVVHGACACPLAHDRLFAEAEFGDLLVSKSLISDTNHMPKRTVVGEMPRNVWMDSSADFQKQVLVEIMVRLARDIANDQAAAAAAAAAESVAVPKNLRACEVPGCPIRIDDGVGVGGGGGGHNSASRKCAPRTRKCAPHTRMANGEVPCVFRHSRKKCMEWLTSGERRVTDTCVRCTSRKQAFTRPIFIDHLKELLHYVPAWSTPIPLLNVYTPSSVRVPSEEEEESLLTSSSSTVQQQLQRHDIDALVRAESAPIPVQASMSMPTLEMQLHMLQQRVHRTETQLHQVATTTLMQYNAAVIMPTLASSSMPDGTDGADASTHAQSSSSSSSSSSQVAPTTPLSLSLTSTNDADNGTAFWNRESDNTSSASSSAVFDPRQQQHHHSPPTFHHGHHSTDHMSMDARMTPTFGIAGGMHMQQYSPPMMYNMPPYGSSYPVNTQAVASPHIRYAGVCCECNTNFMQVPSGTDDASSN